MRQVSSPWTIPQVRFQFDDVLEGRYEVSISYPPGHVDRIGADSIVTPPIVINVPWGLALVKEVTLDEWIYYCEKTCPNEVSEKGN